MVPRESLTSRGKADLPIARERLEIERVLVAEHRVEARRTHPRRGSDLVQGGTGIARPPECFRRPLQGRLRVVGRWPSPARRARFALFPCHIVRIPVATFHTYICMDRYKNQGRALDHHVGAQYL